MNFTKNKYPETEIRDYISKNNLSPDEWAVILCYQVLSEDFIREFQEEVNWRYISYYQVLSEDFIREFSESVNWYMI